jgi:hypothetical protein
MPLGEWFSPERGRPVTMSMRCTTAPCGFTTRRLTMPELGLTVELPGSASSKISGSEWDT